ncbi:MAG: aryl-sulfate sulfotransferase [Saprospiraceae bacterium]|nr:aryl-sulfate sulfotransferase [Saprospiraceae bacterium]
MKKLKLFVTLLLLTLLWSQCKKNETPEPTPVDNISVLSEKVEVDPSGFSPLTAEIEIELDESVRIDVSVEGKKGTGSTIEHSFTEFSTQHLVPVYGLYAGTSTTVTLRFIDTKGEERGRKSFEIETKELLADFPDISIDVAEKRDIDRGLTLVSYFGYFENLFPQRPFAFDQHGDIRWYLDYSSHPTLQGLFYDVGVEQLANGNFYFGDGEKDKIFEVNPFGLIVQSWDLPGYGHHHSVVEKPNGNFLVTVNKWGLETVEDHIIEVDRQTKAIINEWDLRESLDPDRQTMVNNRSDWIHVNAIAYDASDNTIIISGRTQGVVKLTENNEVVWILGNHSGWDMSGNGTDLKTKLLTPLDAMGQPINDPGVLAGTEKHPDFGWNWYQHANKLLPNGNHLMFDNGPGRNFSNSEVYSRAVEFEIDEENRQVRQVWAYGKERGLETYSGIVSDADYLPEHNRVVLSPGAMVQGSREFGRIVEVDYTTKEVLFEATITPPVSFYTITFHRTEWVNLYGR